MTDLPSWNSKKRHVQTLGYKIYGDKLSAEELNPMSDLLISENFENTLTLIGEDMMKNLLKNFLVSLIIK